MRGLRFSAKQKQPLFTKAGRLLPTRAVRQSRGNGFSVQSVKRACLYIESIASA
jgi:hypothetical protein